MTTSSTQLKPTLGTLHLWGIAVGLVISGEYFGWSYGWGTAGTLGFLVTALMVATMYTCFIFSFTELTTAIPHAGGPFAGSLKGDFVPHDVLFNVSCRRGRCTIQPDHCIA